MSDEINVPTLTDEQIARNKTLEGIFVPHARRRRDEVYELGGKRPFARFVHYTSAEAALKIITQKRLWMRNAACMTDYREVQHGFSILLRFFADKDKAKSFKDAVNVFAQGAAEEALNLFDRWWRSGTIQFKTFILSTSEHDSDEDLHGRLSMWRAFGGTAARVGLVFNVPARSKGAEAMKLIFSPVAYFKNDEADQLVLEVVKNINTNIDFLKTVGRQEIVNWIFSMLLLGVTCAKHEGFREEREWRVVHCPQLYPSPLIAPSTEIVGGVPQSVYKLPLDKAFNPVLDDLDFTKLFDRLIIGPSPYPTAMFDAYVEALSNAGVAETGKKIFISGIPIRS
jgi:Protein of unknown function (DUF2971)